MVAQHQSPDDLIDAMVAHARALRSGQPPDRDAWDQTLRWAERQGYFQPARGTLRSMVVYVLLLEALDGRTKRQRHEERVEAAREALWRFARHGPPPPGGQPAGRPTPAGAPTGVQNRPVVHALDRYPMSIAGREVTMGDMTHVDWQRIREQSRSAVVGQATFFARGDLVDTLAMRKGARDDQPYREIVTDAEADAVFSFAEQVGRDVGGDLEARIAAIVANNALFPRQSP